MDELYDIMRRRRTTRKYRETPVDQELIQRVIQAGIYAPSGSNKSPYLVAVVQNPDLKQRIREEAEKVERRFYQEKRRAKESEFLKWVETKDIRVTKSFLTDAPVLLAVFENSEWEDRHSIESTWLTIAYMILAAENEGLSTVTYTPEPKHFLNEILDIPSIYRPQVILPLGYALKKRNKEGRRPEIEERVRYYR